MCLVCRFSNVPGDMDILSREFVVMDTVRKKKKSEFILVFFFTIFSNVVVDYLLNRRH